MFNHLNNFESKKFPYLLMPRKSSAKEIARSYWKIYCDRSSIHAVRHLSDDKLQTAERIFWAVTLTVAILSAIFAYIVTSIQYTQQNLQTVVDDAQYPVFRVPFPAIAICTQKRINFTKVDEAIEKFIPGANESTVKAFIDLTRYLDKFIFRRLDLLADIQNVRLDLLASWSIDISKLANFLAFKCEDILLTCKWREEEVPCCETFIPENTEAGLCHVFNSLITKMSRAKKVDKFYPYRLSKFGQKSGLNVIVQLDTFAESDGNTNEQGIYIMIKAADQWTSEINRVYISTETDVIIYPTLTQIDNATRKMPPQQRNCMFDDESSHVLYRNIPDLVYSKWNCLTQCHQDHVYKYCGCTLAVFFPEQQNNTTPCTPLDLLCLHKNIDIFSNDIKLNENDYINETGMMCPCLIQCNPLEYYASLNTFPFTHKSKSIELDFYYSSEVMVVYHTNEEYTVVELVAQLGGLLGLFIGASIMSAVEIFYYMTIGMFVYLRERHMYRLTKTQNIHHMNIKNIFIRQK